MIKDNKGLNQAQLIYMDYRNISKKFNHKILKYMEQSQKPQHDLNLLGVSKGNGAHKYEESDKDRILDFIIYEKTFNNNSGLDIY